MKNLIRCFLLLFVLGACADKPKETVESKAEYAMLLKTLSNPFWVDMKTGIEETAKELGVSVDIVAVSSEGDLQAQLTLFEDLLIKGYKGIGFAPISPVNLIPVAAQAYKKGVYLVNIDERVDMDQLKANNANIEGFVTTDNFSVGASAAKYIVEQIGSGQVAIIEGKAGNASGEYRRDGALSIFKSTTGIEVVSSQPADWDRTKALDVTATILQRYPNIKAIYAANDTMALGVLQAVKNAQKTTIVVGTDGAPEAIQSVKAGELTATMAQDSKKIGAESLRLLVNAVKNKTPIKAVNAAPQEVGLDAVLITK